MYLNNAFRKFRKVQMSSCEKQGWRALRPSSEWPASQAAGQLIPKILSVRVFPQSPTDEGGSPGLGCTTMRHMLNTCFLLELRNFSACWVETHKALLKSLRTKSFGKFLSVIETILVDCCVLLWLGREPLGQDGPRLRLKHIISCVFKTPCPRWDSWLCDEEEGEQWKVLKTLDPWEHLEANDIK